MNTLIKKLFVVALVATLPVMAFAQPDPGGDPDDTPIPFDGGITLLVAAGVGYGVKKTRDARKAKEKTNATV